MDTITELERRGVGFRSLTESVETTTPGGKLVFHLFAALAEFEAYADIGVTLVTPSELTGPRLLVHGV